MSTKETFINIDQATYFNLYKYTQFHNFQQLNEMHVNMWHIVIQCIVVLGLSSKDTRPHPNTLPIRSLSEVNFWVFHPRDLSPFLIRLTRAFTFITIHFSLSFAISCTFHSFYPFFTQPWCNACHEVNYSHSQVSPISLKLQSYYNSKISQQFQYSNIIIFPQQNYQKYSNKL